MTNWKVTELSAEAARLRGSEAACPLCGSRITWRGLVSVECAGKACLNYAPPPAVHGGRDFAADILPRWAAAQAAHMQVAGMLPLFRRMRNPFSRQPRVDQLDTWDDVDAALSVTAGINPAPPFFRTREAATYYLHNELPTTAF